MKKLAPDVEKSPSLYYLILVAILGFIEIFAQTMAPALGPWGAVVIAVGALIGAILRALPYQFDIGMKEAIKMIFKRFTKR